MAPKYRNILFLPFSPCLLISIILIIYTYSFWSRERSLLKAMLNCLKANTIIHVPILSPGVVQQKPDITIQIQGLYCKRGIPLPAKNLDLYTKERELSPSLLKVSLEIGWRGSWILVQLNLSGVQIKTTLFSFRSQGCLQSLDFHAPPPSVNTCLR